MDIDYEFMIYKEAEAFLAISLVAVGVKSCALTGKKTIKSAC